MRFIHCETFQGAIAAAQLEYPSRELYGESGIELDSEIITPIVIDQLGDITFLGPVKTVEEAVGAAKAYIEHRNRSYVDSVLEDRMSPTRAVQHFEDCGIPLEVVPPLAIDRPYFLPCPIASIPCLLPTTTPAVMAPGSVA